MPLVTFHILLVLHILKCCLFFFPARQETTMRALGRKWWSWWREWNTPHRYIKCTVFFRWRVICTVRRSVSVLNVYTGAQYMYNPLLTKAVWLLLSQQGLWGCHGSNIIAGITRRGDCWSWCLVNRRRQLNRCFIVKKYAVITTCDTPISISRDRFVSVPRRVPRSWRWNPASAGRPTP